MGSGAAGAVPEVVSVAAGPAGAAGQRRARVTRDPAPVGAAPAARQAPFLWTASPGIPRYPRAAIAASAARATWASLRARAVSGSRRSMAPRIAAISRFVSASRPARDRE